jgi:hypothetical protein
VPCAFGSGRWSQHLRLLLCVSSQVRRAIRPGLSVLSCPWLPAARLTSSRERLRRGSVRHGTSKCWLITDPAAAARPRQLSYASCGNGTTPHLSGELFKTMAGVNILHVPYRGASASVTDLIGGHVDMAFVSLSSVVPQLRSRGGQAKLAGGIRCIHSHRDQQMGDSRAAVRCQGGLTRISRYHGGKFTNP